MSDSENLPPKRKPSPSESWASAKMKNFALFEKPLQADEALLEWDEKYTHLLRVTTAHGTEIVDVRSGENSKEEGSFSEQDLENAPDVPEDEQILQLFGLTDRE